MKQIPKHPRRGQRGFSLLEMVVAMVVAVFLLAGLFTVLQANMDTSSEQTALAQLQDNERLAMSIFTNMIESAGYFPTVLPGGALNSLANALPADAPSFQPGQAVSGGGNGAGGDAIVTRFSTNPNDGVSSCLGHTNTGAVPQLYKNTLQVDSVLKSLTCSDDNGVTAVPLVPGVQQLTVLWGVNTQAGFPNANCPANTYVTTAVYEGLTTTQQTNVCAVQITLTFTNPLYQLIPGGPITPGQPATVSFTKVIAIMAKTGPAVT
jgi:type IV pilus assembly protein PilW